MFLTARVRLLNLGRKDSNYLEEEIVYAEEINGQYLLVLSIIVLVISVLI